MTATTTTVPFSRLAAIDGINARTKSKEGIDELAASIAAKGLIQPLCVRIAPASGGGGTRATKGGRGGPMYEVIDGRRRYMALAQLVKNGTIEKSHEVPVLLRDESDAEALETSLMANTVRLPMHPVDQHEAFARLVEQGIGEDEIAARFGISARTVRQQLALGRLAPVIREAWRKGKIAADVAREFTLHPDHDVQASAFERLRKQYGSFSTYQVRRELLGERRPILQCPELAFVGVDAYLAAGGTLTESLFDDERYVDDVPLVEKLARDKLKAECRRLEAEGWSWAAPADELPRLWLNGWRQWRNVKDGPGEDDLYDPEGGYDPAEWSAEDRGRSGCVVELMNDGTLEITAGMIRPETSKSEPEDDEEDGEEEDGEFEPAGGSSSDDIGDADDSAAEVSDNGRDPFWISGALKEAITTAQTEAVAQLVRDDFELALRIALAAMMSREWSSPSKISVRGQAPNAPDKMEFERAWPRVAAMTYGDAMRAFADVVAGAMSLVEQLNAASPGKGSRALVDTLDGAKYLRWMREAFNAADYFRRSTKDTALAAVEEMREAGAGDGLAPEDMLAGMKKADLAAAAAEQANRCGWLPPELRHPAYALTPARAIAAE